jgi:ElaB/YqjD/DUF883 family membrane-anchored ribosome-binding protein
MNKNGITGGSVAQGADDKIDAIKDTVKGFVEQGAHTVDAIKSRVVDAKDQAFDRGGDAIARMTELIKAHPLKAVGIAFGAGYLGMRLFRR